MKAMVIERYGTAQDLRLMDLPTPVPASGDVLVRVRVAAVNDWDWGFVTGKPRVHRLIFGLRRPRVRVLGAEMAGEVAAVGAQVSAWRPGDRVFGDLSAGRFGAFAEYVLVRQSELTRIPDGMDYELAASIPHAGLLAWQGLIDLAGLRQGERVLINGAGGGVGAFGVQIASSFGAEVTGVDSAAKLQHMTSMGFRHVLDYRSTDFTRTGERYDVILDAKATRSPVALCRALRPGGRYVAVGGRMRRVLQILMLAPLLDRLHGVRLHILGLKPNLGLAHLIQLWRTRGLRCPVEGPYLLEDLPRAVELFGSAGHVGKVLVRVGD